MSVEDLWPLMKPQCDCFLYICDHGEELFFLCLFHWLKHTKVLGRKPGLYVEEPPTINVAASNKKFLQIGVWYCHRQE